MLLKGVREASGIDDVCALVPYESVGEKNLKLACGASAASGPVTGRTQRLITEHLLAGGFRRETQHLANIQKRKRPGTVVGHKPTISIEIKFALNCARRSMEPSQILRGLFQDSGRQFSLAGPG
jgi:hypothetical protein